MDHRVYLIGGGGVPNYGDELIIENWLSWYAEQGVSDEAITLAGAHAPVLGSWFQRRRPGLRVSDTARRARQVPDLDFVQHVSRGRRALDGDDELAAELRSELQGTTVLHLHGGGYLNVKWPSHGFLLGLAAAARERFGCRVVGTGLGLHPQGELDGEQRVVLRDTLRAFAVLEVRDEWSLRFLVENELHRSPELGTDDAFLRPVATAPRSGSTLHIATHSMDDAGLVARWLKPSFVQSFDHHVHWMCTASDGRAYAEVAQRHPQFELLRPGELIAGVPISDHDFVITQRFHPHLVAARLGMNGVYRAASLYYDVKHRSLTSLGSGFTHGEDVAKLRYTPDAPPPPLVERDAELTLAKQAVAARILAPEGVMRRLAGRFRR